MHAPQSSNLARVCGTQNPTFGAPGRGASKIRRSIRHAPLSALMEGAPSLTGPSHTFGEAMGVQDFTRTLRRVQWPPKFRPELPPRYDGAADPAGFLQAYEEAVWAVGGDDKVMANWLPMALVACHAPGCSTCESLLWLPGRNCAVPSLRTSRRRRPTSSQPSSMARRRHPRTATSSSSFAKWVPPACTRGLHRARRRKRPTSPLIRRITPLPWRALARSRCSAPPAYAM